MNQEQAVAQIAENLETANRLIEEALNLGREHGVPVQLGSLAHMSDDGMWYVDETEFREDFINDNYGVYDEATGEYNVPELTPEQLEEVDAHMKEIKENGGYDNGYKVLGWMSSSTNC